MYVFHYAYFRYHLYINKMFQILADVIEMNEMTANWKTMFYLMHLYKYAVSPSSRKPVFPFPVTGHRLYYFCPQQFSKQLGYT